MTTLADLLLAPSTLAWAGIVAALAVGVVSPGPSFVMVVREAVSLSRRHGVFAALGMGVGGLLFAAAALAGLHSLLLAVPALYVGLKVLGGLYLCLLAWRIVRGASQPLVVGTGDGGAAKPARHSFWLGLATQVSNPKTAIVYASVFAAFLPPSYSAGFAAALLITVGLVETGWYALVAVLLSSAAPQRAYLACKPWADRAAGCVMAGLGAKLVASAARP